LSIKFVPAKDVASNLKIEATGSGSGTVTLENAYSLKAQGIKLNFNATQPTAGGGNLAIKAAGEYTHDFIAANANLDQNKSQSEIAFTTGAHSCNFWAGVKGIFKTGAGLNKTDSQVMVAYTGPLQVTATSSLDLSKKEISVFSQVNSQFSAACNYSTSVKNGKTENVAKVGFINTINGDSSYRAVVSSAGDVALNYKQKLTASTTLCLGTKLGLGSLSTPAAVTAGITISL
jgi:hypothetical protein